MKINVQLFSLFTTDGGGWVRVFGIGFGWKNLKKHKLTFSERNGYKKHIEIGHWSLCWLT